jgi:MFS family permease
VRKIKIFSAPPGLTPTSEKNFINVQIDAVGVAFASAASPFLPVFLTRLGASNFEVGMLTSMPAITGLFFAIILGRMLQKQKKIVPWFSKARLMVISSYAFTGVVVFFFPKNHDLVIAILVIWALATIPQTLLSITFSVVMNAVAGPQGRYELMTRRWSIFGVTTAVTVFIIGQLLDLIRFPLNYQVSFIILSVGGLFSYYFSSHIVIPDIIPVSQVESHTILESLGNFFKPILREKPFLTYTIKRFVYMFGVTFANPLFPLYFVRQIHAPDGWIAIINTAQTFVMIFGYYFWSRQSRKKGSRNVLLWTTLGVSLYPIATALTGTIWPIAIYAAVAGIFQAGLDLVFFDELMKTIPFEYSATFVSVAQSLQYLSAIAAPLIGSLVADQMGLSFALIVGGVIRLFGFVLFFLQSPKVKIEANGCS